MGRKLEWELSGKSDVPAKMADAKKSMEGVDGAANAMGKKFREAFKDIAVGFLAPMVLIQSAINYISAAIEERKKQVQDALEFANTAEAKLYASQQEIEAARRRGEQKKSEEDAKKAIELKVQARAQFFKEAPEGRAFLEEQRKDPYSGINTLVDKMGRFSVDLAAEYLARSNEKLSPDLQSAFDRFFGATAAARPTKPEGDVGPTAQKLSELSSNVIGVGMSPQLDAMNKQISLQEDMANSLRVLIERDAQQAGFTPNKFWPSARRLNLPR